MLLPPPLAMPHAFFATLNIADTAVDKIIITIALTHDIFATPLSYTLMITAYCRFITLFLDAIRFAATRRFMLLLPLSLLILPCHYAFRH